MLWNLHSIVRPFKFIKKDDLQKFLYEPRLCNAPQKVIQNVPSPQPWLSSASRTQNNLNVAICISKKIQQAMGWDPL
jgi:hypothetical protein